MVVYNWEPAIYDLQALIIIDNYYITFPSINCNYHPLIKRGNWTSTPNVVYSEKTSNERRWIQLAPFDYTGGPEGTINLPKGYVFVFLHTSHHNTN